MVKVSLCLSGLDSGGEYEPGSNSGDGDAVCEEDIVGEGDAVGREIQE